MLQRCTAGLVIALGLGGAALWRTGRGLTQDGRGSMASEAAERALVLRPQPRPLESSHTAAVVTTPSRRDEAPMPVPPTDDRTLDEPSLMSRLRRLSSTDPATVVELAAEGNRRFPNSPDAPERASLLIHALARLGRASEARGEAEDVVNDYPDSDWVREIEQFTGAHRHRNVRVTPDGGIELY